MCKMSPDAANIETIKTFDAKIIVVGTKEHHHFEIEWFDIENNEYNRGFGSEDINQAFKYLETCFELIDGDNYHMK